MFQFSDDGEIDVEDLLKLPLDNSLTSKEPRPTHRPESDNFDAILDDGDDNELILSMIDYVDNSIPKTSEHNGCQKIVNIIENTLQTSSPLRISTATPKITSNQSSIEKYIVNDIKHKLPIVESIASKAPRVEYERKFPGPAGLIPKKSKEDTPTKSHVHIEGSPPLNDKSRTDDTVLESGCWDQLLNDVQSLSPKLQSILDENTVSSVKRMNIIRNKPRKLQFFAAIIMQIDCSICDPSIMLKDSTGEIHGTLHKDIWENHSNLLTVGTALLLKQVSVVSITNSRKLYVNVTSNNVVKTYTPQPDGPILVTQLATISEQDFVQVKKNERVVFEETHPNKINTLPKRSSLVQVPMPKPVTPSNHKTDKTIRDENQVPCSTFALKKRQFTPNLPQTKELDKKLPTMNPSQIPISNDFISHELEGIDTDSLFGEF